MIKADYITSRNAILRVQRTSYLEMANLSMRYGKKRLLNSLEAGLAIPGSTSSGTISKLLELHQSTRASWPEELSMQVDKQPQHYSKG